MMTQFSILWSITLRIKGAVISMTTVSCILFQVKLIVLDSIAFHFRHDFEDLAHRTRLLSGLAQSFIKMACEQQIAVGVKSHVQEQQK